MKLYWLEVRPPHMKDYYVLHRPSGVITNRPDAIAYYEKWCAIYPDHDIKLTETEQTKTTIISRPGAGP